MLFVILLGFLFLAISYFIDADYVTYVLHWYRKKYVRFAFNKKTIWIIGASSGIGENLAYELVKEGAHRVILSSRRQDQLERVKKDCEKINKRCDVVVAPLDAIKSISTETNAENEEIIKGLFEKYKDIDIIVLNLGTSQRGLAMDTDLSLYINVFQLNTLSVIELARSFIRQVRANKLTSNEHVIAVTSSMAGKIGSPGQPAYTTSKHAVNGFFDCLRIEVKRDNFRVSIMCPGPTHVTEESTKGFGSSADEGSGRLQDDKRSKKKMSTERCAELYATALYFKLYESWLCLSPHLTYGYLRQYLPAVFVPMSTMFGQKQLDEYAKHK